MVVHHTPERLAIIRETWGEPVHIDEILRRLNATPGHLPVTGALAAAWASQQGIRRHPHSRRVPVEVIADVTEPVRLAALRRIATDDWTYARLERLCDAWVNGIPAEQIAASLGVSKNAVVGKVHRLAKRGLLTTRPSPIIRTGPREPKPPPAPRPMNVPPPSVTLPPLLSGLPPGLSTERIWDGPRGFNFASRRPPLARWVADDGSSPTGPAQRPCQFVTQPGSVVDPWIFCGLPVSRGAWCSGHRAVVYHTYQRRAA